MKGDFRTLLRRYCSQSSILGLKYFYLYPDPLSRCFWAISFISSLSMSILLTKLLYSRFADMPTRVTIENQHQSITTLPHPAITICSPNQMTISSMHYLNKTLIDGNLTIDLENVLPLVLGLYELIGNKRDEANLEHLQTLLDLNRHSVPGLLGFMAQSCGRFLKHCYMKQHPYGDCSTLFTPILTTHGLCCIHNSIYHYKNRKGNEINPHFLNRTVEGNGISEALTVIADYEPDDALPGTLLNAGAIRVMYTDMLEFPADDVSSLLDTQGESYHVLRATFTFCSDDVAALAVNSRKCLFEDEESLQFFRKYRNSDCDHVCYAHAVYRACGCWPFYLPHVPLELVCDLTTITCIINVKRSMDEWLSGPGCECPRDCESRQYRADVLLGNLDALPYYLKPYTGVKFNKSTTIMHFFFGTPVYTVHKQETVMSIISLVSNLGGVFGLFLGGSCMSLIEILFYIKCAVRNYIHRRWQY